MPAWSVGEALAEGRRALANLSETPGLDAQVLLAEVTCWPREHLLAYPDDLLPLDQKATYLAGLSRLAAGEPLPYVLGWWEFYGRRFRLTPAVLIPRPESELLVEAALLALQERPAGSRLIDLGTGSGCLAVTLALEAPGRRVLATDVSVGALDVARTNAAQHRVTDRVDFARLDLTAGLRLREAVVVANLPYVAAGEAAGLAHEPRLALEAGEDGLFVYRRLFDQLRHCRPEQTTILMEIGASQAAPVRGLAQAACAPYRTWLIRDLAGHERVFGMELQ